MTKIEIKGKAYGQTILTVGEKTIWVNPKGEISGPHANFLTPSELKKAKQFILSMDKLKIKSSLF